MNPTTHGVHPAQPGTAQPHANQPYPAQPQAAQPHPAWPGVAQPHPAPPGTAQPHPGLAQPHPGTAQPQPSPHGGVPTQPPGPYPPTALPPYPQLNQGADPAALPSPSTDPFQDLPWVSDTPTAEEFARRRMAKQAEPTATMGARALLRKGTMGLVKLAPSKHEVEFKQDVEMVRRNFGGLRQVTVVNPKGGAGKTIAVLLLAMTFGQKRGGYVLAWDNNETQGTLGMRAQQDFHARTVRDMMRDLHLFRGAHGRVGDLSQYVRAQGEGMFDVLASDESATAGEMLTASAFAEIREIVSRFYKLIVVDTGNNVRAQNWQAAMDATDQLVITMSARNDSAETAARMLDHLEQSGRQRLVRQAVSIVSMPPTRKDIDLPAIQRHFAARTRAVLLAPYEKLIDSGEPLRYGQLSAGTKEAWLKIAAAVAEGL
ncbi:MAG TPA: cobalamin biosynthesis protein CobQ [Actinoplanes sp.]